MIGRREFVRNSAMGAVAFVLGRPARLSGVIGSSPADSRIEVLLGEVLGTISPNIYGHFLEHLGGVIYDGVWVGESSKIANIKGIRKDLVDEMRKARWSRSGGAASAKN